MTRTWFGLPILLLLLIAVAAGCQREGLRYPTLPLVAESPVQAGRPVPLRVERCNDGAKPLDYSVARTLVRVDGAAPSSVVLDGTQTSMPPGCEVVRSLLTIIPPDTAPGIYEVRAISSYLVRDRRRSTAWTTTRFEVIP